LYQISIHSKVAVLAAARLGQTRASATSALRVAKKLSAMALSRHSPARLIEQVMPRAASASRYAAAVYWQQLRTKTRSLVRPY